MLQQKTSLPKLDQKRISWFSQIFQELGIAIISGGTLSIFIGEISQQNLIWLFILSLVAWYISYKLIAK